MNFRLCPHPTCDAELLIAAGTPEGERGRCGECKKATVWRGGELVAVPEVELDLSSDDDVPVAYGV